MSRDIEEPHTDKWGDEEHPAWTLIGAYRSTCNPGVNLFDSDILHQNTITIRLKKASRKRELHHDWLHGKKTVVEVELSEAQWAAFVSSMNSGDGVACTVRYSAADGGYTPSFPHKPRLAETIAETHGAADRAFAAIQAAMEALDAADTTKTKREAMATLRATINNATPNVDFAGKVLVEHAESVVQKAKADVEAFVTAKAHQLGIESSSMDVLELTEGTQ
jgi:hypothetical protein